jgi:hypothetical protein
MSHFTKVKTVIRDQEVLEESLRELDYQFRTGEDLTVRGYSGNRETAQVLVDTGSQYDIGFQRQPDENFQVIADWWGVEGNTSLRQESFLDEINRTYAYQTVRREVVEQGYLIEHEKVHENGEIEMVVVEGF